MRKLFLILIFFSFNLNAQDYFIVNDGVKTKDYQYNVFKNANIHSSNGMISNGMLIEKDGKIIEIGVNLNPPKNSVVYDLKGQYIYPSFVETHSSFGVKKPQRKSSGRSSQYEPSRNGYYWNDHILSDYNSFIDYNYNQKEAKEYRDIGFGVVNSHRNDGIHRGTSFSIGLIDGQNESYRVLSQKTAEHYSFSRSLTSGQSYPSSTMGAIALIRQLHYDSNWYSQGESISKDLALEAVIKNKELPKFFDANDKLNVYRAAKLSEEFNLNFIIKGSGKEYENVRELKKFQNTLIIPVNFPKAFDASNSKLNDKLTINQLRYWNQAPANLGILEKNGVTFSITSSDLKNKREFLSNIKKAIKNGLSEKVALESLTIIPARSINLHNKIGKLEKGFYANFLITSGPIFGDKTAINENWVKGQRHIIKNTDKVNLDGTYTIQINDKSYEIKISNSLSKPSTKIRRDSIDIKSKVSLVDDWLSLTLFDSINEKPSFAQISTKISSSTSLSGTGSDFNNNSFSFTVSKKKVENNTNAKKSPKSKSDSSFVSNVTFPNVGFGLKSIPNSQSIHFKNATLWTNESDGIIENSDIIINNGKIVAIGKNLETPADFKVIDATNKHITSGIIDEHSHMAASSINEGGHNSSAEVSIMDVINPDDINVYRNLAGGVTTAQILHGSANPIGGQSAIIKFRWGASPQELLFEDASPFIKFALGENVKQSNWGNDYRSRFPQTRMGVEQVYYDHFYRAREYAQAWKDHRQAMRTASRKAKRSNTLPAAPRRDLELETLAQILNEERFVTCHSYRQDEINMLMHVADSMGFTINTFTHILEGYKVADKMAEHGAGGSSFSDWWAYKFEVKDAIPYNGAIMHNAGVTVAFNSDDAEMSRRLNQEAAKAVKYGGISEEDAWKFVTLNPAKLLHLDHRIGSIKAGKDADLVLWSDHPLSIYATAEKTLIEGTVYYDAETTEDQLKRIETEKQQIISQMLMAKENGAATQNPTKGAKKEFTCETLD